MCATRENNSSVKTFRYCVYVLTIIVIQCFSIEKMPALITKLSYIAHPETWKYYFEKGYVFSWKIFIFGNLSLFANLLCKLLKTILQILGPYMDS